MTSKQKIAGYVPAVTDADGGEDPAPTPVVHATEAVGDLKNPTKGLINSKIDLEKDKLADKKPVKPRS